LLRFRAAALKEIAGLQPFVTTKQQFTPILTTADVQH
jgi:hypothetical protein